MEDKVHTALFLCTGNSARSILGEAILNRLGEGRLRAYSAGSNPIGAVNPLAISLLRERGYPVAGLRSKSWDEFAGPGAPEIDFVFTVCDSAAKETCPIWPGHPMTAHWGVPDPAAVEGVDDEKRAAFAKAYNALRARIGMFLNLRLDTDDTAALRRRLNEIGRSFPESA
jgi:arsenate reductase